VFGGPTTLGQLAAAEQVKPPTMSRIVAGLKRSGLVDIVTDRKDARRLQIRATAKGSRLLHQGRRRRIEYLAEHLEMLSAKEQESLRQVVEILERLLSEWK